VDANTARQRFAASIARILALVPDANSCPESSTEVIFRLHGLEFVRARFVLVEGLFRNAETITFGLWRSEYTLDDCNAASFCDLVTRLAKRRSPDGDRGDPLFPLCPRTLARIAHYA